MHSCSERKYAQSPSSRISGSSSFRVSSTSPRTTKMKCCAVSDRVPPDTTAPASYSQMTGAIVTSCASPTTGWNATPSAGRAGGAAVGGAHDGDLPEGHHVQQFAQADAQEPRDAEQAAGADVAAPVLDEGQERRGEVGPLGDLPEREPPLHPDGAERLPQGPEAHPHVAVVHPILRIHAPVTTAGNRVRSIRGAGITARPSVPRGG